MVISVPTTPATGPWQHAVAHDHVEEFVTVVDVAFGVRHDQAVRVAVEAHRDVAAVLGGKAREVLGVGRAHAVVDVEAVWSVAHGDHFGAEFVEDVGRNVIGGAVGAVDENAQALEVRAEIDRRLAELDVAAGRIVKAAALPSSPEGTQVQPASSSSSMPSSTASAASYLRLRRT